MKHVCFLKILVSVVLCGFFPLAQAASPAPNQQTAEQSVCANCGVVKSISIVEVEGKATGGGAIVGGIAGGLIGNQIGSGRGNTLATVGGLAGGAYVGHQVEKKMNKKHVYKIIVNMDDGTTRTVKMGSEPGYRAGDRVKVVGGRLSRL